MSLLTSMRSLRAFLAVFLLFSLFLTGLVQAVNAQATGAAVVERRAELQKQLDALQKEIDQQRSLLEVRRNQRETLERDIAILTAQITQAKLSIKARNIVIQNLSEDIKEKQGAIEVYSEKIEREKASLADLLRKTVEIEASSPVEIFLSQKNLSKLFEDVDMYEAVRVALRDSYTEIGTTKKLTEREKAVLEEKKVEQTQLLAIQNLQKKRLDEQEAEKKKILALTKGIEAEYQKILKDKELSAAGIRSQLFSLQGSSAIPFEKALDYAQAASKKTGVRPAIILGIIAEESNLGQNVGTGNWRTDMHPTRDQPIFAELMRHLGFNPDLMPVSKKAWYGYGGAMGPAQFIPSTWILYAGYSCTKTSPASCVYNPSKDRIGQAVGQQPPNPWDPPTAFMATAILMKDNGAAAGTRYAERLAALRYLAGWANATKSSYAFYGDDVMSLADKFQKQIDILERS